MKQNEQFITAPLDDGLIVARRNGDRLVVMNGSARFMWERRAEGIADADIPRLAAMHYGIGVEQAHDDFCKTLRCWQAEGLAEPPGNRRHYSIGGISFGVLYRDAAIESMVAPIFAHLECAGNVENGKSSKDFDLAAEGAQFVVRANGIEILKCSDIDALIEKLTRSVVMHAEDRIKGLVSMHAAAIGTDRHCVLVPGASGSGKSTLAAGLLASRRISYLSDDISPLDGVSLRVVPMPGALVLKSGSWQALGPLLPELSDLTILRRRGQQVRYWLPPVAQVATAPLPVSAVVFPRYESGRTAELSRLSSLEGVSRLIAAPCTVSAPITTETIDRVLGWARAIPFYTLAYGSLADATKIVEDLLEL
jgi:hypothetical protein